MQTLKASSNTKCQGHINVKVLKRSRSTFYQGQCYKTVKVIWL